MEVSAHSALPLVDLNPIPAGELENQDTLGGVLNTIPAGVLENQDTLGGGA